MLILGIVGILLVVCSFVFAVINMTSKGVSGNGFRNHGLAMIGMFLGGLTAVICLTIHFAPIVKQEAIEVIREVKK